MYAFVSIQIDRLSGEKAALERNLVTLNDHKDTVAANNAALAEQKRSIESENRSFLQANELLRRDFDEMKVKRDEKERALTSMTKERDSLQAAMIRKRVDMEELERQRDRHRRQDEVRDATIYRQDQKIRHLQQQLASLQGQKESAEQESARLRDERDRSRYFLR